MVKSIKNNIDLNGALLWQAGCKWRKHIEAGLKEFNLTHPQFVILSNINTNSRKVLTQVEIAEKSQIDVATTSQIIRYLEKKSFIKRVRIDGDERAKYPKLTKKGEAILTEAIIKISKIDQEFFIPIDNDTNVFLDYLLKLNI